MQKEYHNDKVALESRITKLNGNDFFDFGKQMYDILENEKTKEFFLENLKQVLLNQLCHLCDNPKIIHKMHFNLYSIIDIFPFAINQNILAFFGNKERSIMAKTCKDFYKMHRHLTNYPCSVFSPYIRLCLNAESTLIKYVGFKENKIDYPTLQRCLQYYPKLHLR